MTQDEKELLLKDLSARLPYGVKVYDTKGKFNSNCQTLAHINGPADEAFVVDGLMCRTAPITDLKPYLFPLSSITEEQKHELIILRTYVSLNKNKEYLLFDWLNANHFDYRDLILMGLAIDATNLNIY